MTKINPAEILSKRLEWPNVKTSKLIHLFTNNVKEQLENKSVVSVYMFGIFYKTPKKEFISFDPVSQQNILYPPKIEINFADRSNHSNTIPDTDKTESVDENTFVSIFSKSAKTSPKEIKTFLEEFFDTIFDLAYFEKNIPIENFGSFHLESQDSNGIEKKLRFIPDESFQNKINIHFSDFQPVSVTNNDLLHKIDTDKGEKTDINHDVEKVSTPTPPPIPTTVENNIVESAPPAPIIVEKEKTHSAFNSEKEEKEEKEGKKKNSKLLVATIIALLVIIGGALSYLFFFVNNNGKKEENYTHAIVIPKNKTVQTQDSSAIKDSTIQTTNTATNNITKKDTLKTVAPAITKSETNNTEANKNKTIENKVTENKVSNTKVNEKEKTKSNETVETNKAPLSTNKIVLTSGQSLRSLATEHFGHRDFWVYIYLKNKDKIKNPNVIPNGTEIIIPSLSEYNINPKNPKSIDEAKDLGYEVLRKLQ